MKFIKLALTGATLHIRAEDIKHIVGYQNYSNIYIQQGESVIAYRTHLTPEVILELINQ